MIQSRMRADDAREGQDLIDWKPQIAHYFYVFWLKVYILSKERQTEQSNSMELW
jgi:hypothetical protein